MIHGLRAQPRDEGAGLSGIECMRDRRLLLVRYNPQRPQLALWSRHPAGSLQVELSQRAEK
jgi:hypothetical protein